MHVAYATGSVSAGLARVVQQLVPTDGFGFVPSYAFELSVTKVEDLVLAADKAGVTALEWVNLPNRPVSWNYPPFKTAC